MPWYRNKLNRKLDEATELHKAQHYPDEQHLLGADGWELERLGGISPEEVPHLPQHRY
jgi:hypothetical protein